MRPRFRSGGAPEVATADPSLARAGIGAAVWLGLAALAAALVPPGMSAAAGWALAAAGPSVAILIAGRAMAQASAARRTAEALAARLAAVEAATDPGRGDRRADAARQGAGRSARSAAPPPAPSRRQAPPPPEQAALPLGAGAETASWRDVLRALEFPRDEADEEGMAALRAALRDPLAAQLLQAAEDVLSILAANGLHMEDLRPVHGGPAAWLAYAEGARGPEAEPVGGVLEPAALEAAEALLKGDPVFRDAALVFLRRWNLLLGRAVAAFGESEALVALADTRTGRAFMLLARALGAFDAPAGFSRPA